MNYNFRDDLLEPEEDEEGDDQHDERHRKSTNEDVNVEGLVSKLYNEK